ncbi:GldG family protein, partial [bacterium]|nr:GldG family protein [bacterium]
MKNRTSTKKDALILGMAVLIILFVLNFLSARHFIRLDLTKDNEYTLADSTKRLLKGLDDIITVRVYFTKDLPPALFSLKRSVDDVLDEYKTYAKGNFRVEYIDPQESPQQEQTVMMMGIPPLQVNVLEKDKRELTKVYLGMAVLFEDRQEILPAIQTVANLEYQLASAILRV